MDEPIIRRVVCPGSFDPITNGHLDIIGRASHLFDEVVVAVGVNAGKAGALFTVDERIELVERATAEYGNVRAEPFEGLLVDFCARHGIRAIMKGLRAVSDYEYELQMSHMNHRLSGIETLFVASNPLYSYLSSSLLKEVASLGGDVSGLVPDLVLSALTDRLAERKKKSA
jgi:pantetheine-phosphate adenylyltransferase